MSRYDIVQGLDPSGFSTRRIAVAMSGGVDSSLSALLLQEAGFDVTGLTMKLWSTERPGMDSSERGCCDLSSIRDAQRVADEAGFPHYTVNLEDEFEQCVVSNFVDEYLAGRTPNPCVLCNTEIKWRALMKKAEALGCELLATGHYVRTTRFDDGTHALVTGVDTAKDQSYFLWGLTDEHLSRTVFPLGGMTKEETRREAAKRGLKNAQRPESQEICFITDNNYRRFLRERLGDPLPEVLQEGDILTEEGEVIGRHNGAAFYTIGQRRGLGVAMEKPMYVNRVDSGTNTITIGGSHSLLSSAMIVQNVNWMRGFPPGGDFTCRTRIRYRHNAVESAVETGENGLTVRFETPQRSVTPGQSAVFYDGEVVLGGGIIAQSK